MKMRPPLDWLTDRERVVLIHLMDGLSAEQIAELEFVGVCTVRSQIRSILQKLHVKSQLAAVAYAYRALWPTDEERKALVTQVLENAS